MSMIDDIVAFSECSDKSIETNAVINKFVESKKLEFGEKKCHQVHIGKNQNKDCRKLKVHGLEMKKVESEKYVGDLVSSSGQYQPNIAEKRSKGFGVTTEILSILREVPLGRFRVEIGLRLRNVMLINSMLCNSEV